MLRSSSDATADIGPVKDIRQGGCNGPGEATRTEITLPCAPKAHGIETTTAPGAG
jgi:hypothetical protein